MYLSGLTFPEQKPQIKLFLYSLKVAFVHILCSLTYISNFYICYGKRLYQVYCKLRTKYRVTNSIMFTEPTK